MTARILVGIYPAEFGYEKAAFDRACLGKAHLHDLPLPLIMEIMRCVGDLSSFLRFFQQTSKTLKDFLEAEQHVSLWTCITQAKVDCTRDYEIKDPRVALLQRCASGLKSLEICPVDDYSFSPTTYLSEILIEMKALRSLTCTAATARLFPTLPVGDGILPCLETLNLPYVGLGFEDQQKWKETFPKLQSLTINVANLWPFGEDLKGLFHPPRGRLRVLHVMDEKNGGWAENVDVQILDILGGREEPPPLPTSLVEEFTSNEVNVHRGLEQALNNGLLPQLRVLHLWDILKGDRVTTVDTLVDHPPPALEVVKLTEVGDGSPSMVGLEPDLVMRFLKKVPLREINMRHFPMCDDHIWKYESEYERKREEDEEESDYCEGEGPQEAFERVAPQNWVGSPTMASAFADAILQNDALRVLYLSEGGFATLARGIKHRTGLTPEGKILMDFHNLEALVVGYKGRTDNTDLLFCQKINQPIALRAPYLQKLWIARNERRYSIPLSYVTPQLREVDLISPDMNEIFVCDDFAAANSPFLPPSGSGLILEAPHLRRLDVCQAGNLKKIHVDARALRKLCISGPSGGELQLQFVTLQTPMLDHLHIKPAARLRHFSLHSFVIAHLVCGSEILAFGVCNRDADFERTSKRHCRGATALSTLDVCCPALRSLNLGRFVGGANNFPDSPGQSGPLTSLIVEQREAPAQDIRTSAMACVFEGLELDHSTSLQSIIFRGKSPEASAPTSRASPTPSPPTAATTNNSRSSPYRAPLKHFKIGVAHTGLTSVEFESGWTMAPEAKRGLAYFALEYPHVQVRPKPTAAAGAPQTIEASRYRKWIERRVRKAKEEKKNKT